MGYGTTIFMVLIGVSFIMYLGGYHSAVADLTNPNYQYDVATIFSGIGITLPFSIAFHGSIWMLPIAVIAAMLGGAILGGVISNVVSGFSVIYSIPAAMAVLLLMLFSPITAFLTDTTGTYWMPNDIRIFLQLLFFGLLVMAMFEFVRGGGA